MLKVPPTTLAFFWAVILFSVQSVQAHEEFEITSTARLQHHRLEVEATMTLQAGGGLLAEGSDPEFALRADNFELYRERLQTAAMNFYEVTAGGKTLIPAQASVTLPESGHLRFAVIYPQPAAWPLKFRPGKVSGMPTSAISDLGVYDQGENLLGKTVMVLRDPVAAELSVDPASPVASPSASPLLVLAPPVIAPPEPLPVTPAQAVSSKPQSWLGIVSGLALGLVTLILVVLARRDKTSPTV